LIPCPNPPVLHNSSNQRSLADERCRYALPRLQRLTLNPGRPFLCAAYTQTKSCFPTPQEFAQATDLRLITPWGCRAEEFQQPPPGGFRIMGQPELSTSHRPGAKQGPCRHHPQPIPTNKNTATWAPHRHQIPPTAVQPISWLAPRSKTSCSSLHDVMNNCRMEIQLLR